jgi:hypothetical protein
MDPVLYKKDNENIISLYVSVLSFSNILGTSNIRLFYEGNCDLSLNSQVRIVETHVYNNEPTGRWVSRYIVAIEPTPYVDFLEEGYYLHLSPFLNNSEPLGLSRVRKSDNLE